MSDLRIYAFHPQKENVGSSIKMFLIADGADVPQGQMFSL